VGSDIVGSFSGTGEDSLGANPAITEGFFKVKRVADDLI
jgi:hypothetical protein